MNSWKKKHAQSALVFSKRRRNSFTWKYWCAWSRLFLHLYNSQFWLSVHTFREHQRYHSSRRYHLHHQCHEDNFVFHIVPLVMTKSGYRAATSTPPLIIVEVRDLCQKGFEAVRVHPEKDFVSFMANRYESVVSHTRLDLPSLRSVESLRTTCQASSSSMSMMLKPDVEF